MKRTVKRQWLGGHARAFFAVVSLRIVPKNHDERNAVHANGCSPARLVDDRDGTSRRQFGTFPPISLMCLPCV